MDVWLFLPQMRMTMDAVVDRARAAEAAGLGGIAFMDHLAPPMAEQHAMFDAMVTAAWVAARTDTLRIGHLVLCDAFRHPVVLAKQVVSLDHASGGRFELGIGWGSVPTEFPTFGIGSTEPKARVDRLAETLEVLRLLFTGDRVSYDGRHHQLVDAVAQPAPTTHVPVVIGGVGPRTLDLVKRHADWWNLPVHRVGDLEALRPRAGDARVSVQLMVAHVPPGADRAEVEATAKRRWPGMSGAVGGVGELVDRFGELQARGVERVYAWCTDFATTPTLDALGEVAAQLVP
jgi:alkanesulfonate monooxygenase SsuD/methylene tetrahydromethanopterin reductase-like flavin-dependent oxidoreductase (luciferase family)